MEKVGKELMEGIVAESWEISSDPDGQSIVSNGVFEGVVLFQMLIKLHI